ncbi:amidase [Enterovirga aerilata]|uniref:Amidase n=1 Tax=Enterovirga aerilata TaxID=2730920 RepID=A0A849ID91_9HYPH|nr:amidase [Enterovirga sp. DB1703]NNM73957.1 amidase [Enterovirga sp. DB1703]
MTDLADLNATELLRGFRAGDFTPVEVAEAVIARITAWEPKIAALYHYRPEEALATARDSAERWRRGEARALDGVPVTIKENIATRGAPMPLGTAARELAAASDDAPAAARLREAGAVILAKTTMPDYGMLSSGLSSFHPLTRNPWDTSRNPGGSSSGAGAAAAAGYGPLHVGTDIGGSIRLPAGWCGVFGLKPSFGRVPVDPPYWGRVAGPMTRTAADAALMMRELSRPDPRDGMSLPPAEIAWEALEIDPKGLRIGLQLDAGIGMEVAPEVRACIEGAARLFEAAGAIVEPVAPFLTREMLDGLDIFWRQRAWADIAPLAEAQQAKILPYILRWAEGGRDISGAELYRGLSQMGAIRDATLRATEGFDFVLSPVAPCASYPAELASPIDDPDRPFEHICFTVPYNFSEQPAASVNAGYTASGLPIGLQIAGRRFDDIGVLRLSAAFERMRGEQRPWPEP